MSTDIDPKAALQKAVDLLNGQAGLAEALDIRGRNVWPWFLPERRVPSEHCPGIERACEGRVTAEELRPDIVWTRVRDKDWPHPKGRPCIDVVATADAKTEA